MKTSGYNFNKIHNTYNCYNTYLWAGTFSENLFEFKEYFWHKQVYGILMKKRVYAFITLIMGSVIIFIILISSVKLSSNGMTQKKIVPLFSHTSTTFTNFLFCFCFDEHMASYFSSVFLLLLFLLFVLVLFTLLIG